jgi:hypothetical protein
MARLEFTDEEFKFILQKAQELYATIDLVRCPYFPGTVIRFNTQGFEHLRRKSWNRGRPRHDQFMRLKYLKMAPAILRLSNTVQGIYYSHERIRQHSHGRWVEVFSPATFYEFVAVIESRRFKVIVKLTAADELLFWSIIPYWRHTERGTRVLYEGNPAED